MNDDKNNRQYFVHNNLKIIITEHFSENGKCFEDVIKDAIIRDSKISAKEQNITRI